MIEENQIASNDSQESKILVKIDKVLTYWNKTSLLIPNVFRLTSFLEEDSQNVLEYQDLSRKEVLVNSTGLKIRAPSTEEQSQAEDESTYITRVAQELRQNRVKMRTDQLIKNSKIK
jgi:hypothetical protein